MKDLSGMRFGRYIVLEFSHRKGKNYYWKCKCDCGNERVVNSGGLNNGQSRSCGCYNREIITKHGLDGNKLYHVLLGMKNRCYSDKSNSYKDYGGRGIKVCEEWLNNPQVFVDWALENGYKEGLSIERIDVNGNYEPSNCKWANKKEQANNTRTNIYYIYEGRTLTLSQWAEELGMKMNTLHYRLRIKGWNIEKAFKKPVGR